MMYVAEEILKTMQGDVECFVRKALGTPHQSLRVSRN